MYPKLKSVFNVNTAVGIGTLGTVVVTVLWFLYPLQSLPGDMLLVKVDVVKMQQTQAVQTETLKTLAEITREGRELRKDFESHSSEAKSMNARQDAKIEELQRRLDRLGH